MWGGLLPANTDMSFPLTSEPDDDLILALTELSFVQFLSAEFGVVVGKIQTLDGDPNEFASGRGRSQFMNASFVFNPVTAVAVPYSTLGAGVVYMPSPQFTLTSTFFNTADASTTTGFGDIGDGWTWTTEAQFQYVLADRPGGQNLTVLHAADNEFLNFNRTGFFPDGIIVTTENDTWAVFWSGWQYLVVHDPLPDRIDVTNGRADLHGFGLFARAGIADNDTNPIEWTLSVGLGGRGGLFPGRDEDTYGIGVAYTSIDQGPIGSVPGLLFDDRAYGVEAYYNLDLAPGVALSFDIQVIEPVVRRADTSTTLGARLNLRF
jgi:porin